MNGTRSGARRPWLSLGARAATVAGSYLVTALVVLAAIVIMRRMIAAPLLRDALSFFFIATLAAGLEPATVKAAVLGGETERTISTVPTSAYLCAGALKAAFASPFLAVIWAFSDPELAPASLIWTPLVVLAGFAATDLRVLFDVQGRHALAIWLKQGSLMGGLVVVCVMLVGGAPLFWAIGISTVARLALIGVVTLVRPGRTNGVRLWPAVRRLLGDRRWFELAGASALAAASGSIDRVLALRYLAAATYSGYFLLYELFTKFWLLPYLLAPIIFVRRAARQESALFIRRAWGLTLLAGLIFVLGVAGVVVWAPFLLNRFVGADFGPIVIAFAAAIVIGAFAQLRIADLQGAGATRRATIVIGVGGAVSAVLFFVLIRRMGVTGLFLAWLIKSVAELAATTVGGNAGVGRKQR